MTPLEELLSTHRTLFRPVVSYDPQAEKLYPFNFTRYTDELTPAQVADTQQFASYISRTLAANGARFGVGGYNEDRVLYRRSQLFEPVPGSGEVAGAESPSLTIAEPRTVHLGGDIWGRAGTAVFSPLEAQVHSVAFNNQFGDYGSTLILMHQLYGSRFHTLYGHISRADIEKWRAGDLVRPGELIAHFGEENENGWWPPHLHFQVIENMEEYEGDYPGVCAPAERAYYLNNCPNPDYILNLLQHL